MFRINIFSIKKFFRCAFIILLSSFILLSPPLYAKKQKFNLIIIPRFLDFDICNVDKDVEYTDEKNDDLICDSFVTINEKNPMDGFITVRTTADQVNFKVNYFSGCRGFSAKNPNSSGVINWAVRKSNPILICSWEEDVTLEKRGSTSLTVRRFPSLGCRASQYEKETTIAVPEIYRFDPIKENSFIKFIVFSDDRTANGFLNGEFKASHVMHKVLERDDLDFLTFSFMCGLSKDVLFAAIEREGSRQIMSYLLRIMDGVFLQHNSDQYKELFILTNPNVVWGEIFQKSYEGLEKWKTYVVPNETHTAWHEKEADSDDEFVVVSMRLCPVLGALTQQFTGSPDLSLPAVYPLVMKLFANQKQNYQTLQWTKAGYRAYVALLGMSSGAVQKSELYKSLELLSEAGSEFIRVTPRNIAVSSSVAPTASAAAAAVAVVEKKSLDAFLGDENRVEKQKVSVPAVMSTTATTSVNASTSPETSHQSSLADRKQSTAAVQVQPVITSSKASDSTSSAGDSYIKPQVEPCTTILNIGSSAVDLKRVCPWCSQIIAVNEDLAVHCGAHELQAKPDLLTVKLTVNNYQDELNKNLEQSLDFHARRITTPKHCWKVHQCDCTEQFLSREALIWHQEETHHLKHLRSNRDKAATFFPSVSVERSDVTTPDVLPQTAGHVVDLEGGQVDLSLVCHYCSCIFPDRRHLHRHLFRDHRKSEVISSLNASNYLVTLTKNIEAIAKRNISLHEHRWGVWICSYPGCKRQYLSHYILDSHYRLRHSSPNLALSCSEKAKLPKPEIDLLLTRVEEALGKGNRYICPRCSRLYDTGEACLTHVQEGHLQWVLSTPDVRDGSVFDLWNSIMAEPLLKRLKICFHEKIGRDLEAGDFEMNESACGKGRIFLLKPLAEHYCSRCPVHNPAGFKAHYSHVENSRYKEKRQKKERQRTDEAFQDHRKGIESQPLPPTVKNTPSGIPWMAEWCADYRHKKQPVVYSAPLLAAGYDCPFEVKVKRGSTRSFDPDLTNHLPVQLKDKYKIFGICGEGSEGKSYFVHPVQEDGHGDDIVYVMKKLPVRYIRPVQDVDSWKMRQIQLIDEGVFNHDGFVKVIEQGVYGDYYVQVMECMPVVMDQYKDQPPLLSRQVHWLVRGAVYALAHLHDQGVVHRDLKLSNIALDHKSQVRLLDYGLVKRVGSTGMTQSIAFTPDMVAGFIGHTTDAGLEYEESTLRNALAQDHFTVGVFTCQIHTGKTPFSGEMTFPNDEARYQYARNEVKKLGSGNGWLNREKLESLIHGLYREADVLQDEEEKIHLNNTVSFISQALMNGLCQSHVTQESMRQLLRHPYILTVPPEEEYEDEYEVQ